MSQLNCTNKIADCNQNELAVNNTCYQYSASNNNSGTVFEFSNDDIKGNIIGTDTNINLQECAVKCYQNPNCSAIRFNISPEDSDGGLLNEGDCYYYGYDVESKNSLPSWSDKCSSIYTKNIVDNSNKVSIGPIVIDLNTARTSDNSQSQVKTKYTGSDCRRKIASDASGNIYDFQTIQDMSDWCSKNQNVDSCKNFCDNDAYTNNYCPWKSKITKRTYILIGIWFLLVFLMVYLYIRAETNTKKKLILSSFSIVLIGLLIYIVYTIGVVFGYFKGSTENDYASNIANISGSGTCDSSGNGLVCKPFGGPGCVNQPEYLYYGVPYYFKSVNKTDSNGNKVGYCGGLLPPEGYIGQQIRSGEQGNEGWFNILETTTDVSNLPGIFMIYGPDGTLPSSDLPSPVTNGDTITLKNISQNTVNNGQFFGLGNFNDYNFCVCDSARTCQMGTNNDNNRFNTDKGYTFQMLDSVSSNNKQQLTIVSKNNKGVITLNDGFVFKILGQDIFVSCNPSRGDNNYFLIDPFGNAPQCSNSNGSRYVQTSTNTCPAIISNNTSFPSTSCTDWCSDVRDYATPKPASVWVFSAEKVNSS